MMSEPLTPEEQEVREKIADILRESKDAVAATKLINDLFAFYQSGLKKTKAYWHPITKLRIRALRKMYLYVLATELNEIDVADCGLDYSERSSLTILRFHGLIAKVKDEEGHQHRRKWLITRRGAQFLRNQIQIPAKVKTYNNVVVDHSEELVGIIDVLGEDPKMPPTLPFERATPTVTDVKKVQAKLL